MAGPLVVRTRYGTSISIDPAAEGPMSVRELATLAASRLGMDRGGIYTLAHPADHAVLDYEETAPTSGTWELVDVGAVV